MDKLPLITLAAGVAAAESIQLLCGMEIMLKWPNDLYLDGRKLGGILTETSPLQVDAMPTFVVVGMGINVNSSCDDFPSELRNRVTSLYCLTHRKHDLDAMLELIMKGLLENVTLLRRESEELLQRWRARDMLLGKRIRWDDPRGRELTGTGQGLLDDGRYRLTTDEGREYSVLAGDITLREIDGRTVK
ncbi:MAG: hypothetical protein Kow0089_01630 [Desulfobulbaceae bacterium]